MKNIFKYIFIIALISANTSCDKDFLNEQPIDYFSTENAFQTENDLILL